MAFSPTPPTQPNGTPASGPSAGSSGFSTDSSSAGSAFAQLPPNKSQTNIGGITIKAAAANPTTTPVQGISHPVNPGEKVFIKALPTNTKPIQVAMYPVAAVYGPCDFIGTADAEREFPCSDISQIWITGQVAGEGISVSIRKSWG